MANMRIAKMLREIVQTYEHLSDDGGVKVTFRDETMGAGLTVSGREGPLGQVFRNLIDNAISFSPEGGEVSVTLKTGGDWRADNRADLCGRFWPWHSAGQAGEDL